MNKLLIVDDSADLLEMMKYILERKGYIVKTLMECRNIFHEIFEFKPDLLILDLILAGADGREICKELRKNIETEHLGVLAFSASPKTLIDYKSFYADDFLEKPFDSNILVEKIKSLLYWVPIRKKAYEYKRSSGCSLQ